MTSREPPKTPPPPQQLSEPLRTRPNAMEVYLLALALFSAVTLLAAEARPFSVDALLGPVWALLWAGMLIFGGSIVLAGMYWPCRPITGVALQQFGYTAFAVASLARGVAQIGVDRAAEAPVVFGFAVAAAIRIWQLEVRVRSATSAATVTGLRRRRDGGRR